MTRRLGSSLAGGLVAVVVASLPTGCSTSPRYATPSATCSNGPRWPRGTQFEYERNGPTDAPACTPHCGPNAPDSAMWGHRDLTSDALPSGACNEDGVVCTMHAEWLGPCPPEGSPVGPLDVFICRCASGAWTCTVDATAPSATMFTCRLPDGSSYPAPDGGASGVPDGGDAGAGGLGK